MFRMFKKKKQDSLPFITSGARCEEELSGTKHAKTTPIIEDIVYAKTMLHEPIYRLGLRARDKITGYEGIIYSFVKYLYGCNQYGINPGIDKDGKLKEVVWFDEGRIEIVGEGILAADVTVEKPGPGGDNRDKGN